VKHIIERFCGGSAEQLLIGMVQHDVLSAKQLERLVETVRKRKRQRK